MKKFVSAFIAVMLALSLGVCAQAAVSGHADDYYWQHRADVTPDGKKYIVNSPDGYVTAWNSPEEKRAYGNISNGTALEVTASYLGWNAVTYINTDGEEQCYWIPSDMMTERVSGDTFLRDSSERLSYDKSDLKSMKYYKTDDKIYLYTYPGSGVVSSELEGIGKFDTGPIFSAVYTDYEGMKWGYLEYYGDWNYKAWICLNDPENGELPANDNGNAVYEPVNPCDGEAKIHYSIALKDPKQEMVERVIIAAAAVIVIALIFAAVILSTGKGKRAVREEKRAARRAKKEERRENKAARKEQKAALREKRQAELAQERSEKKALAQKRSDEEKPEKRRTETEKPAKRRAEKAKPIEKPEKRSGNSKKGRHEK